MMVRMPLAPCTIASHSKAISQICQNGEAQRCAT